MKSIDGEYGWFNDESNYYLIMWKGFIFWLLLYEGLILVEF